MFTNSKLELPIANGYYLSQSLPLSCQRCINWTPIVPEVSSLSKAALDDPSGIVEITTTGQKANRGSQPMGEIVYFVNGQKLYSINDAFNVTELGTISGINRVSMANNGYKLCIVVPGGNAYVYDSVSNTLSTITDPDFIPSSTVVFKDGYYVFTASNGNVFFCSQLNDPSNIDPLDFGTAEVSPDKIVAGHVNHNELYILGTQTVEDFQNIGGNGFPFQRIEGANIQKGCYAPFSLCEFDNSFLFIGGGINEKPAIWRVTGSTSAEKISSAAIDLALQEFTADELFQAFSYTWSERGNFFAAFTIQSSVIPSKTFVYDATSSTLTQRPIWHQRQTGVDDNCWRVSSIVYAFGKTICFDLLEGKIGYLDRNTFTDYGEIRYREVTTQPFFIEELTLIQGDLEVTMESGTGDNNEPLLAFQYSDNGGRLWSYETTRSFGRVGEYQSLCIWRRNGYTPRHRILRFSTTAPVKSVLIKVETYKDVGTQ